VVDTTATEGVKSPGVNVQIKSSFTYVDSIGKGIGIQNGQFTEITGITVLSNGSIVALDWNQNWAQIFDSTGAFITRFTGLLNPFALTKDDSDNIFILEQSGVGSVQKFSDTGALTKTWTVGQNCRGVKHVGNKIYVASRSPNALLVINTSNDSVSQAILPGIDPYGIDFDNNSKTLFIVDNVGNRIVQIDTAGQVMNSWGSKGSALGKFDYPTYLSISPHGEIYVSDQNNKRIQVFKTNGDLIAVFGTGRLSRPQGLAFDTINNVYVADADYHYIFKFRIGL
jgi:YVTN family beta-propeller protein